MILNFTKVSQNVTCRVHFVQRMQEPWKDPTEVTTFSASYTLAPHLGHLKTVIQNLNHFLSKLQEKVSKEKHFLVKKPSFSWLFPIPFANDFFNSPSYQNIVKVSWYIRIL